MKLMQSMSFVVSAAVLAGAPTAALARSILLPGEQARLNRFEIDPALHYSQDVRSGQVHIDNVKLTVTVTLQARHAIVIEVPIVSTQTDDCGIRTITALVDQRPVDGNRRALTVTDRRHNRCPMPMHLPAPAMTEVAHDETTAGMGGRVESFHSVFSGEALRPEFNPSVESFDLYGKPEYRPGGYCDVGTRMTLDVRAGTATLENFVDGVCELFIAPDRRVYKLALPGIRNASGTRLFGRRARQGGGFDSIAITDHRNSVLPVDFDAKIVVREERIDGRKNELFSTF